jgi:hypothetical protein
MLASHTFSGSEFRLRIFAAEVALSSTVPEISEGWDLYFSRHLPSFVHSGGYLLFSSASLAVPRSNLLAASVLKDFLCVWLTRGLSRGTATGSHKT